MSSNAPSAATGLAAENEALRRELDALKSRLGPAAAARIPREVMPEWDGNFAEILPDAAYVVLDDNTIAAINTAGVAQLGAQSAKEIIGRSNFDFIHPTYHAETREHAARVRTHRRRATFLRRRRLRLDSSEYPAEVSAMRVRYGDGEAQFVVVRDISDRVRQDDELTRSRAILADAAASISDGIAVFDAENRLVFANDKFLANDPVRHEILAPGVPFENFIRHTLKQNRNIPLEDFENQVRRRLAWFSTAGGTNEFRDALGRWFLVAHRKTAHGYTVSRAESWFSARTTARSTATGPRPWRC